MAAQIKLVDPPSSASSESDSNEKDGAGLDSIGEDVVESSDGVSQLNVPAAQSTAVKSGMKVAMRQKISVVNQSIKKTVSESVLTSQKRTIYTAGRPPWYNTAGQQVEPFVIGEAIHRVAFVSADQVSNNILTVWMAIALRKCTKYAKYAMLNLIEVVRTLRTFVSVIAAGFLYVRSLKREKGICGGSASGKTTVARLIIEELDVPWVTLLSMDSFYRGISSDEDKQLCQRGEYNFDHPDAFDFDVLKSTITRLKEGKKVDVPIYNFKTHKRENRTKTMYGANVVIFEGILAFHDPELLKMLDMKVFVETDADIRLARRLKRDIIQRGRELDGVLKQYLKFVKPAFSHYIAPCMAHADIIVPRGGENRVAIELIVQHVHMQLSQRGFALRESLASLNKGQPLPSSLFILPVTPQIKGLHTFIRNKETARDEFVFYSQRLMRLVIEYALSLLPFKDVVVETPQGTSYQGKRCIIDKICGVSILRAGETMEQAFSDVCKDTRIGKILIQTNRVTEEPELYYLRLPKDIKDYMVILMDATVATGAAAMMAIRVLLDHDVPEENILIVSLLMAESGVHTIAYAFPQVRIVTTAVDPEINEKFYVIPGIGNFGDRYFGTEPDLL